MHNKHPLFPLGGLYSTPGALAAMDEAQADGLALVTRHVTGDWTEMAEEDQQANELAIAEGSRVFSAYHLSTGVKLWIITEADRSATTLLLPDEY
jgi:hypothetical protein